MNFYTKGLHVSEFCYFHFAYSIIAATVATAIITRDTVVAEAAPRRDTVAVGEADGDEAATAMAETCLALSRRILRTAR